MVSSSVQNVVTSPVAQTSLPWNGAPVDAFDLHTWLAGRLANASIRYLPRSITLFFQPEIPESSRMEFIDAMAAYLACEFDRRQRRAALFTDLHLFSAVELESFLTDRTAVQPWALFYSEHGGLAISSSNLSDIDSQSGVIPCSTMQNHGVAWRRSQSGELLVWLATAPKVASMWDWDSDIGHESAHAAFAPVPLFVQPSEDGPKPLSLSSIRNVRDLEPAHIARICYLFSEIAVVAVRGEPRPTATCLPIADRDELFALLALADELAPGAGFDTALRSCHRVNGIVHPNEGVEVFEVAAPVMRVIPKLTGIVNAFHPPDLTAFQAYLARC